MTAVVSIEALRAAAGSVADPELPVLTLDDLGIVRSVRLVDGEVQVDLTPTYTGCPATAVIAADVQAALLAAGATRVRVRTVLTPPWSTDDISPDGRRKLQAYGIAPPGPAGGPVTLTLSVRCPQCGSFDTRESSRFGSTPCKSLWICSACREPFDAVKPL